MDNMEKIYTVMFADVAGSTQLYERMGDQLAKSIIDEVIGMMSDFTKLNSGTVIKTIGDEVMCRFDDVNDAVDAACQIQEKLNTSIVQGAIVSVRIGLHAGPAILQSDGDLFGDAVNVAARMAGIAKGRQIILTQSSADLLTPQLREKAREFDRAYVKGKSSEIVISELVWENSDVTQMVSLSGIMPTGNNKEPVLELACGGQKKVVNKNIPELSIGRGNQSDLIVNASLASRSHAKIAFRRGKFILSDMSTNGTFVLMNNGQQHYLRREELLLTGSGKITLGQPLSDSDETSVIDFSVID